MYTHIEELIATHVTASGRLAFFEKWTPDEVYPTICAFATDAYFTGGGHIVIGIAEKENGNVKRPVKGIKRKRIEAILKHMQDLDKEIRPTYHAQAFVETVDNKLVLVLYCPTGTGRPYRVAEQIIKKNSERVCFIRENAFTLKVDQGRVYSLLNRFSRNNGGGLLSDLSISNEHGRNEINVGGIANHYNQSADWNQILDMVQESVKIIRKGKKK